MLDEEKAIEQIVLTRLLRLNATILGIIAGVLVGGGVFLATNFLILKGGEEVGPHLYLLSQFFIGYDISFVGSLIGFAYGFVAGFVVAYVVGTLYNWLADFRESRQS